MENEFTTYEQSLALKELGFNEPCFSIYYSKDKSFSWHHHKDHTNDEPMLDNGEFNISATTYSAAFRWFREKHGICTWIERLYTDDHVPYYRYSCEKSIESPPNYNRTWVTLKKHTTYEEAELACLIKLIEVIKERNGK
jgi:hypothetical protein